MNTLKSAFFFITGLLACPCHLPVTLPLLLALTAGTALGTFLSENVWLIAGVSTIYFLAALTLGFRYLGQEGQACEVPKPKAAAPTKTRAASDARIREV